MKKKKHYLLFVIFVQASFLFIRQQYTTTPSEAILRFLHLHSRLKEDLVAAVGLIQSDRRVCWLVYLLEGARLVVDQPLERNMRFSCNRLNLVEQKASQT
jgi:hypothetical protein